MFAFFTRDERAMIKRRFRRVANGVAGTMLRERRREQAEFPYWCHLYCRIRKPSLKNEVVQLANRYLITAWGVRVTSLTEVERRSPRDTQVAYRD